MQNPRPISPICSKNAWGVNNCTVDATGPARFCSHGNDEINAVEILDLTRGLWLYGQRLDDQLVGEVALATYKFAYSIFKRTGSKAPRAVLVTAARTIGRRVLARALRAHRHFEPLSEPESGIAQHDPLREVESEIVLGTVTDRLAEQGLSHDRSVAVILNLLGWTSREIAHASGHSPEAVKKSVWRSRDRVLSELRRQFAQEVA